MREVKFYKTISGDCPAKEFLDSIYSKDAKKVTYVLKSVQTQERVPTKNLKKLSNTDNIWEVRIKIAGDLFRILGFFDSDCFILTNGFQKKTQKTPPGEIALAEKRKKDYLERTR